MRRFLLVTAMAAAISAWGQTGSDAPQAAKAASQNSSEPVRTIVTPSDLSNVAETQEGCPVHIVNASFDRPGHLMLTSQANADNGPILRLDYRNFSDKDIESVLLTGWIKVKNSPYQLDSVTYPFTFELSRKSLLGKDVEATDTLKLASNALGLDRIELSQVTYTDGRIWKPERQNCVYHAAGNLEGAAK